jgi:hypothetical protein
VVGIQERVHAAVDIGGVCRGGVEVHLDVRRGPVCCANVIHLDDLGKADREHDQEQCVARGYPFPCAADFADADMLDFDPRRANQYPYILRHMYGVYSRDIFPVRR